MEEIARKFVQRGWVRGKARGSRNRLTVAHLMSHAWVLHVIPLTCSLASSFQLTQASAVERKRLVWSDEFDDEELDPDKWIILEGDGCDTPLGCGWGQRQLDMSSSSNVYVQDGHLVVTAQILNNTSPSSTASSTMTSARLSTFSSADFLHGRVEVRAKLPIGGWGGWTGFWLMPSEATWREQASCVRVDIAEVNDVAMSSSVASLHFGEVSKGCKNSEDWPDSGGGCAFSPSGDNGLSDGFHVYAVEWEPRRFRWFVDEWHYCTKTQWLPGVAAFPAPFNTNFHLEMALAVGGGREDFGLDDVDISALPQYLIVDYVRISQDSSGSWWVPPATTYTAMADDELRNSQLAASLFNVLALVACVIGPYMALTGRSRSRTNTKMMGIEVGIFKAANALYFVFGSDVVALAASIPFGLLSGYLAVRHRTIARWNTVAGLAVSSLLLLIDIGMISDIGSRYVGWAIFFVLTVTFTVLTCPPEHHAVAFIVSTAATGGSVLKLGLGHLMGAPGEIFKILDDPISDRCYLSRTCRSLTWVSAAMFFVGLWMQRRLVRAKLAEKQATGDKDYFDPLFTPPRAASPQAALRVSSSREASHDAEPSERLDFQTSARERKPAPSRILMVFRRAWEPFRAALRPMPAVHSSTGSPLPVPIPHTDQLTNALVSNDGDTVELVVHSPSRIARPISTSWEKMLDSGDGKALRKERTGEGLPPETKTVLVAKGSFDEEPSFSISGTKSSTPSTLPSLSPRCLFADSTRDSQNLPILSPNAELAESWRCIDQEPPSSLSPERRACEFGYEALRRIPRDTYSSAPKSISSPSSNALQLTGKEWLVYHNRRGSQSEVINSSVSTATTATSAERQPAFHARSTAESAVSAAECTLTPSSRGRLPALGVHDGEGEGSNQPRRNYPLLYNIGATPTLGTETSRVRKEGAKTHVVATSARDQQNVLKLVGLGLQSGARSKAHRETSMKRNDAVRALQHTNAHRDPNEPHEYYVDQAGARLASGSRARLSSTEDSEAAQRGGIAGQTPREHNNSRRSPKKPELSDVELR